MNRFSLKEVETMNHCKKIMALLCAMVFSLSCTYCLAEEEAAATPDLYETSLKVVSVMNEMVQSRDYLEIFMILEFKYLLF